MGTPHPSEEVVRLLPIVSEEDWIRLAFDAEILGHICWIRDEDSYLDGWNWVGIDEDAEGKSCNEPSRC